MKDRSFKKTFLSNICKAISIYTVFDSKKEITFIKLADNNEVTIFFYSQLLRFAYSTFRDEGVVVGVDGLLAMLSGKQKKD